MTSWTVSRRKSTLALCAVSVAAVLIAIGATALGVRSGPYAPRIDPARFTTTVDNPFFDLIPGTRRVYQAVDPGGRVERTVVEATAGTRRVMGVTCVVVRSTVTAGGRLVEDEVDWYAQDADGSVWYFGEQTAGYPDGPAARTDASWLAGLAGAQPGVVMPARPRVGQHYRMDYHRGVAEDHVEVVSRAARVHVPVGTFAGTLMTRDTTPLEPDLVEYRYYAEGVGLILTATVRGPGGRTELVELTRAWPR